MSEPLQAQLSKQEGVQDPKARRQYHRDHRAKRNAAEEEQDLMLKEICQEFERAAETFKAQAIQMRKIESKAEGGAERSQQFLYRLPTAWTKPWSDAVVPASAQLQTQQPSPNPSTSEAQDGDTKARAQKQRAAQKRYRVRQKAALEARKARLTEMKKRLETINRYIRSQKQRLEELKLRPAPEVDSNLREAFPDRFPSSPYR